MNVYIIANDRVFDWTAAWYNSVRNFGLNIKVIPYAADMDRTQRLFENDPNVTFLWPSLHPELFEFAHELFDRLHPSRANKSKKGFFYKYFPNFLESEPYLYSDIDVVFLENPAKLEDFASFDEVDFYHFGPVNMDDIYREGQRHLLPTDLETEHFSGGLFMARPGLMKMDEILSMAIDVNSPSSVLNTHYTDQPFLNQVVDTLGIRKRHIFADIPGSARSIWPNPSQNRKLVQEGPDYKWICPDYPEHHGRKVWLIHWAGYDVNAFMPLRSTFLKFRLADDSWSDRVQYEMQAFAKDTAPYARNRLTERLGAARRKILRAG